MKIPISTLDAYIQTLPREALERLARNVMLDLYGVEGPNTDLYEFEGNDGHLDSDKEWDGAIVCDSVVMSLFTSGLYFEDIKAWVERPSQCRKEVAS